MKNTNEIESALELFVEGKFEECTPIIAAEALFGDSVRAIEVFGLMLQFGLGVERDVSGAVRMFERAVALGSGVAAHNLGTLYQTCGGSEVINYKTSNEWFAKAIELGFSVASKLPTSQN